MIERNTSFRIFRGVVTGTSGNKVYVQRNGQGGPDPSAYPRLDSYTPVVADEVLCMMLESLPIVLGKIAR